MPVPEPEAGEAQVSVRLAGICGTDLEMLSGYSSFTGIPGHEFIGTISHCPERPEREGERVVGEINASCGSCPECLRGSGAHCPQRTVLGIVGRNGAFAEYLTLPEPNLITVPNEVSDRAAVFVEPLAAALEIFQQIQVRPEDRVLLIGAGRLGQLIAQVLGLHGCPLAIVCRHESQQAVLHRLGIETFRDCESAGDRWDIVIEATGSKKGLNQALGCVRPRGTVVLKSTCSGTTEVDFSKIVVDEIRVVGSRCGPFRPAMDLLCHKHVQTDFLVDEVVSLDDALQGFERSRRPGALKVLLDLQSQGTG